MTTKTSLRCNQITVHGKPLSQALEQKLRTHMAGGPFTAVELVKVVLFEDPAHSDDFAMRATDRLIQRERKAGRIKFDGRAWTWIEPAKSVGRAS